MKKTLLFFAILGIFATALTGCGSPANSSSSVPASVSLPGSAALNTDQTDKTKMTKEYIGKDFDRDGIGIVTFRSCTDGDTANFKSGNLNIKVRFLGINTPESTAVIQPWGIPANNYVCNIVKNPNMVILAENDVPVFGKVDSSGNRHLAFIWYKPIGAEDSAFRLLNLEMVDQAFSYDLWGGKKSTVCNYEEAFREAEVYARSTGARIYGETDPSMPPKGTAAEKVTINELRKNYDKYGKTESFAGVQLQIEAIVVGLIGDNLILRDLNPGVDDEPDTPLAGIYAFVGYNSGLASFVSVGDVVSFYCRATTFNGTIQLSDVKVSAVDKYMPFRVLAQDLTGPTEAYPFADIQPYEVDTSTFTQYTDYAKYSGMYIKTQVTVRNVDIDDTDEDGQPITTQTYFNKDANNNYTCYASSFGYLNGSPTNRLVLNLRVDGSSYPYINTDFFKVGTTYECKGYLAPFHEKYQLQLFNNIPSMNYVVAV